MDSASQENMHVLYEEPGVLRLGTAVTEFWQVEVEAKDYQTRGDPAETKRWGRK